MNQGLNNHGETLAAAAFPDSDISRTRDAIFAVYTRAGVVDRGAVKAHLRSSGKTRAANLLEDYPQTPTLRSDGPEAREWLIALEQFVGTDEPDEAAEDTVRAAATQSAANLKRFQRQIADNHAWRARLNEAAQKAER